MVWCISVFFYATHEAKAYILKLFLLNTQVLVQIILKNHYSFYYFCKFRRFNILLLLTMLLIFFSVLIRDKYTYSMEV